MLNDLDNRIKRIADISPTPENEQKLRDELQMLCLAIYDFAENDYNENADSEVKIKKFIKDRLNKLDDTKILGARDLQASRRDLNVMLLKIFKKLDKDGGRISFFSKTDKVFVTADEKAMKILFERLMSICKKRMSVEIKEKRIKIKSDCRFSELNELRNCKSDSILVINKILKLHSSAMFIHECDSGSEISISLDGMLCNKSDQC